jgi:hypothetical protein
MTEVILKCLSKSGAAASQVYREGSSVHLLPAFEVAFERFVLLAGER